MNLLPSPNVTLSDADVADVLGNAVRVIGPLLDVLWGTDPLRVKQRTYRASEGPMAKVGDALGWVLNVADVPGTTAWEDLDTDERIGWWVCRVGGVNTMAVAFPGFLGVMANRLPLQDLLGFANQAMVLCAVARECGVTDQGQQVRLLAAVLCERDLAAVPDGDDKGTGPGLSQIPRNPVGVAKAVWHLMGVLNAVGDELAKRPHPRAPFRTLGMLPVVGVVAHYFGELGALSRAAKRGRAWIAEHVPAAAAG
ncbi:MAG: hypothetical protein WBB07_04935 [Mycobacterium sp.]